MRKILLYSSALVVSGLLSGVAEAACIQTPSCSSLGYTSSQSCNGGSLGYTSSQSCNGGIKCPFGNAWNCTGPNNTTEINQLKTEISSIKTEITEIKNKITEIEQNGSGGTTTPDYTNCTVGAILYSDMSCNANVVASKIPIGVVFDTTNHLAIALDTMQKTWSDSDFDVPTLSNITSFSTAIADWQGKNNTRLVLEYCEANSYTCQAFEYVNSYKTEGTKAGDWYLPALGELKVIYENMSVLNTALGKIGGKQLLPSPHWSSSEYDNNFVWRLMFYTGSIDYENKDKYDYYTRPVLAF